jgi:hypothetical protein
MKQTNKAFAALAIMSALSVALGAKPDNLIHELKSYREWTKVTPSPMPVDFASIGG